MIFMAKFLNKVTILSKNIHFIADFDTKWFNHEFDF